MFLRNTLKQSSIEKELHSKSREGVVSELTQLLVHDYPNLPQDDLHSVLLEREKLGSTGIGHGVAILHGKLHEASDAIIGFGRSTPGIEFNACDGEPVHLFFVLVAPQDSASLHLKAMARLSRLLKNPDFRDKLMGCESAEALYETLVEEDDRF